MDLPTPNFIRGLRADIGALHHTLHSLALSDAERASSCQFDASPIDGEEWVTAPQQLVEEVFGEIATRTCGTAALCEPPTSRPSARQRSLRITGLRASRSISRRCTRASATGAQAEAAAARLPTKEAAARLLAKLAGGATQTDNASPAIAAQRKVSVEPAGEMYNSVR